ncbi:SDR family NAD(P)-dependent oxidoreductase [Chloroflexota bacterium]
MEVTTGKKEEVVLVTGGAAGIGRSIVETFASEGIRVAIVDIDIQSAQEVAQGLINKGLDALAVECDVAKVGDIEQAVHEVIKHFGRIDFLVNNAGGNLGTPYENIMDVSEEDYDKVLHVNLKGTFFFIKAVLPHMMRQRKGRIVNVASSAGRMGYALVSPQYSSAKAGVLGLTRNLAKHLGHTGICINAVAPGFTMSGPRIKSLWDKRDPQALDGLKLRGRWKNLVSLGRLASVEEQAQVVLFLCSKGASYINGATVEVDGGFVCA